MWLPQDLLGRPFGVPEWLDVAATGLFAFTGAIAGIRAGYDYVGAYALAFATAVGGGILRDAVLLGLGIPAALKDWRYTAVIIFSTVLAAVTIRFFNRLDRFNIAFTVVDGMGLGLFAVAGIIKSFGVHLEPVPAITVGIMNAVGGGVLRDILAHQPPLLFRPSQYYALAALAGCMSFVALVKLAHLSTGPAGSIAVVMIMVLRLLSVHFNWQTKPLWSAEDTMR